MRRSRGEGSVYQRKGGLWVGRYEAAGKRKYVYGKNKKAVTDKLRERFSSGLANLAPEADGMSVEEYLDRWLPTVKNTVKERTWNVWTGWRMSNQEPCSDLPRKALATS